MYACPLTRACYMLHRPPTSDTAVGIHYKSTFLGTVLTCTYQSNRGVFRSDSMTVISILQVCGVIGLVYGRRDCT